MTFLIHLLFQKMHADFLYTVSWWHKNHVVWWALFWWLARFNLKPTEWEPFSLMARIPDDTQWTSLRTRSTSYSSLGLASRATLKHERCLGLKCTLSDYQNPYKTQASWHRAVTMPTRNKLSSYRHYISLFSSLLTLTCIHASIQQSRILNLAFKRLMIYAFVCQYILDAHFLNTFLC